MFYIEHVPSLHRQRGMCLCFLGKSSRKDLDSPMLLTTSHVITNYTYLILLITITYLVVICKALFVTLKNTYDRTQIAGNMNSNKNENQRLSSWLGYILNTYSLYYFLLYREPLPFAKTVYYIPFSGDVSDFSSSPTRETDPLGKPRFKGAYHWLQISILTRLSLVNVSVSCSCSNKQPQNLSGLV